MRLLALEQGEHQLPVPVGHAQYASLSIYRGPTLEESRLIEHLVARNVPVTDELSSLQVEFADELEERATSIVVKPHRSPWVCSNALRLASGGPEDLRLRSGRSATCQCSLGRDLATCVKSTSRCTRADACCSTWAVLGGRATTPSSLMTGRGSCAVWRWPKEAENSREFFTPDLS
jgi:hypothetical protein